MSSDDHVLFLPPVSEEAACLPLPINVVSQYWNVQLPMAEAVRASERYAGFAGGILIEGIELAERHGLSCAVAHSSLRDLRAAVDAGIPPIVILPGIPGVPEITQHASVVSGYGEGAGGETKGGKPPGRIYHYVQVGTEDEGVQQEGAIPAAVFDREWSEEGRLIILVAPPDVLASAAGGYPEGNRTACRLCFDAERSMILGDVHGASGMLDAALRADPTNQAALQMLGGLLNGQDRPQCVEYYEGCIRANADAYLACNGLGNYYLKRGELARAEELYTRAIGINPKRSARVYKNRAYLRQKLGRAEGAKEDLLAYLHHLPNAPDRGVMERAIREMSQ